MSSTETGRACGLLLHPSSLPGPFGIGDFGPEAYRFVDFLAGAGQSLWQVLPLGPTGYGNSPYQSYSAFAGNPLLLSPERLADDGLLRPKELSTLPALSSRRVEYDAVYPVKWKLLRAAHSRFRQDRAYAGFCREEAWWLDDYALFMALREQQDGKPWTRWPEGLRDRSPHALRQMASDLAAEVSLQKFVQYEFHRQYRELKRYANDRGVRFIGDIPIFVAHDSADVWTNPGLFFLDEAGEAEVVAGVPPDYFSENGQLWGNPLYRWDVMARDGYAWWVARMRKALELSDLVRIDHFRGFQAYWEVPAGETTARNGRWVEGPGAALFERLREEFPSLPVIAEDLGLITQEVRELRDQLELPGMRVLQFAFSDPSNIYLPHHYTQNSVAYTGTHDNDTTRGWWRGLPAEQKEFAREYLARRRPRMPEDLVRAAMSSVARLVVLPVQDVLGLGSSARMNTPGRERGNWEWRLQVGALDGAVGENLLKQAVLYGRASADQEEGRR